MVNPRAAPRKYFVRLGNYGRMRDMTYLPVHPPRVLRIPIRSLEHAVYLWGADSAPAIFLLHGFADTAMSFQFLADRLADRWRVIAPDLQGFGATGWNPRGYWFPDYFADLDALLNEFSPDEPVRLAGHSMGGNIATHYAGILPERVALLVSLDSFGLRETNPEQAPERFAEWLRQWRTRPEFNVYDDENAYAGIIRERAPHITADRAVYLAPFWSKRTESGKWTSRIDPNHKMVNPILYRRAEARACWQRIRARTLLVLGGESKTWARYYREGGRDDFHPWFADLRETTIPGAGHMIHLDQPELLARTLDDFFSRSGIPI
ncbi:MAG: alpha/beta hydrolase [Gammaproteobacteria bacterium]|nr:MAG: alpha/beta hydrolase [Gammaproteobacteria bacterium]